jgi:hypothetical protein
MVGDRKWEEWMAKVCKPFTRAKIGYFDAADIDAARARLAEAQPARQECSGVIAKSVPLLPGLVIPWDRIGRRPAIASASRRADPRDIGRSPKVGAARYHATVA